MPLRIPAGADLRAALVLAQADRGNQIDERPGIRVRHVTPDDGWIVGRVLLIRHLEHPRKLLALCGHLRVHLELDVHIGFRPLLLADRAVLARHAVVEHHHVVLNHPEPFRFGILPGSGRILFALHRAALRDVRASRLRSRFLVVPEREPDRPLGLNVGTTEHVRQLHHERGAGAIVIRGLAPALAIHVAADDVHLFGVRGADFRAVHHLAWARCGRLHVDRANRFVRLCHRIGVDAGARTNALEAAAALREVAAAGVAAPAS